MVKFIPPLLITFSLLISQYVTAEYLSVFSGYQESEHSYLTDSSEQQGALIGASLDTRLWRRQPIGWWARGIKAEITQAPDFFSFKSQIPVYQWHKHQGTWLEVNWVKQDFQTTISEAHTFLGNDGTQTPLNIDSVITTERQLQQIQFYWLESSRHSGALNLFGISYSQETSPAAAEISNSSATYFDGKFTGTGLLFGRNKDTRGLNFQWRLNIGKQESDFSNSVTGHRGLSASESQVFNLAFSLQWHYRYYLAPYWYLAPHIKISVNALLQGQSEALQINHDSLLHTHYQSWLSVRRYF
jgi:hypothetical protein